MRRGIVVAVVVAVGLTGCAKPWTEEDSRKRCVTVFRHDSGIVDDSAPTPPSLQAEIDDPSYSSRFRSCVQSDMAKHPGAR